MLHVAARWVVRWTGDELSAERIARAPEPVRRPPCTRCGRSLAPWRFPLWRRQGVPARRSRCGPCHRLVGRESYRREPSVKRLLSQLDRATARA